MSDPGSRVETAPPSTPRIKLETGSRVAWGYGSSVTRTCVPKLSSCGLQLKKKIGVPSDTASNRIHKLKPERLFTYGSTQHDDWNRKIHCTIFTSNIAVWFCSPLGSSRRALQIFKAVGQLGIMRLLPRKGRLRWSFIALKNFNPF